MTLKNISSMDAFRQSLSEAGPNGLILIECAATRALIRAGANIAYFIHLPASSRLGVAQYVVGCMEMVLSRQID